MSDVKSLVRRVLANPAAQRIINSATDAKKRAKAIDDLRGLIPAPARWFINRHKFRNLIETQVFARISDARNQLMSEQSKPRG